MAKRNEQNAGEQRRWERWLHRIIPPNQYWLVLALVLMTFIAVMLAHGVWGRVVVGILMSATLLASLVASQASRGWILLATIPIIGWIVAIVLDLTIGEPAYGFPVFTLIQVLLLLLAPYFILHQIVRQDVVTVQSVLGAVSVYFLFGIICAMGYAVMGMMTPAYFFDGVPQATPSDYLFFSFTTLTTVGYGNLVPTGNAGRALAMLEATSGQVYLVVVVARLVALWQVRTR